MIPIKSQASENAQAVHTVIASVADLYGRQLSALVAENTQLRQELAIANGRLAAAAKQKEEPEPPSYREPGSEL